MKKRIQSDKKNTEKPKKRTKTNNTLHIQIENPNRFAKMHTRN
jgi:hypothetical protein